MGIKARVPWYAHSIELGARGGVLFCWEVNLLVSANKGETKRKAPPHAFKKGQSGNPRGRPKANPEVKEILKAASPDAARKLVELVGSRTEKIALAAATEILDRTMGRPETTGKVQVEHSGSLSLRAEVRAALLERLAADG